MPRYAFDQQFFRYLQQLDRKVLARALNLGGSAYGAGGPAGGFIGYLPQDRISYDSAELASDAVPASGISIIDNLNHIRKRLEDVETRQEFFITEGAISQAAGNVRLPNHTGVNYTISGVYLDINTAPTGDDLIVDIHMDGVTIFTDQNDRPVILAGEYSGYSTDINVSGWENGSYLQMDVDQVGSSVAGSDLTVTIVYY